MSLSAPAPNDCPPTASGHPNVYVRTLHRACELLGGIGPLAHALRVRRNSLHKMLLGRAAIPTSVFLAAVDICCCAD
jgi:hypothetical protein